MHRQRTAPIGLNNAHLIIGSRLQQPLLQLEAEARGKAHSTQHAQRVCMGRGAVGGVGKRGWRPFPRGEWLRHIVSAPNSIVVASELLGSAQTVRTYRPGRFLWAPAACG